MWLCFCVILPSLKNPGSSQQAEPEESLNSPTDSGSPQCRVQEGPKEEQVSRHLHVSPKDDAGRVNMTCVTAA